MNKARYVFKKNILLKNMELINLEMKSVFSNFQLAYSFKTNSYDKVLSILKDFHVFAEVVSPFEYALALSKGYDASNIIYNGVCKDYSSINDCVCRNGIMNIDNNEDFDYVCSIANDGIIPNVGLRLSFDNGAPVATRFGVSLDSALFSDILEADRIGKIKVNALHCHFTSNRRPSNFRLYGKVLGFYARKFHDVYNIDFGGNLPSPSQNCNYKEFAVEMKKGLFEGFLLYEQIENKENDYSIIFNKDLLIEDFTSEDETRFEAWLSEKRILIEPGTALVKDAFDVRCNVIHIKKGFIITDASFFDVGESAISDKCKIKVINRGNVSSEDYVENYKITGYTCMENDILKKSYSGKIKVGDEIIFMNCGAYSVCFGNSFINPPLPVEVI